MARSPVAKHLNSVNRPKVEVDRKKEEDKTGSYLDQDIADERLNKAVDIGQWKP